MEGALANLRKQHLWGDLTDEEYRAERRSLQRQLKALTPPAAPVHLPNLERAATLLNDLPAMWVHPGTNDRQRESLVQELLERATVSGTSLVGVQPRPVYQPLFGYIMASRSRNRPLESTRSYGSQNPSVSATVSPCTSPEAPPDPNGSTYRNSA